MWDRRSLQMMPEPANIWLQLHETPQVRAAQWTHRTKLFQATELWVVCYTATDNWDKRASLPRGATQPRPSLVLRFLGNLEHLWSPGFYWAVLGGLQTKSGTAPAQPWNPIKSNCRAPRYMPISSHFYWLEVTTTVQTGKARLYAFNILYFAAN